MKIAIATDHAGFEQAKELAEFLDDLGHEVQDFGPKKLDPNDDYPDFIMPAAKAVADGNCDRGIILGRSGQGEAMAANRFNRVRCSVFYAPAVPKSTVDANGDTSYSPYEIVTRSRQHQDANMLSLASSYLTVTEMKNVIKLWLETPFSDEERHVRRLKKFD